MNEKMTKLKYETTRLGPDKKDLSTNKSKIYTWVPRSGRAAHVGT